MNAKDGFIGFAEGVEGLLVRYGLLKVTDVNSRTFKQEKEGLICAVTASMLTYAGFQTPEAFKNLSSKNPKRGEYIKTTAINSLIGAGLGVGAGLAATPVVNKLDAMAGGTAAKPYVLPAFAGFSKPVRFGSAAALGTLLAKELLVDCDTKVDAARELSAYTAAFLAYRNSGKIYAGLGSMLPNGFVAKLNAKGNGLETLLDATLMGVSGAIYANRHMPNGPKAAYQCIMSKSKTA